MSNRYLPMNPIQISIRILSVALMTSGSAFAVTQRIVVEDIRPAVDDKPQHVTMVRVADLPLNNRLLKPERVYGDTRFRHSGTVTQIIELPKTKRVVTSARDGTVRVWDLRSGKQLMRLDHKIDSDVWNVRLVDASEQQILTCGSRFIYLWDLKTGKQLKNFKPRGNVLRLAMIPGKKQFVTAGPDSIVHLWDMEQGKSIRQFKGHSEDVYCVAVSSDGKTLVSSGDDKNIFVFDLKSGNKIKQLPRGHTDDVMTIRFNRNSSQLVSCGSDDKVICWDTDTWKQSWTRKLSADLKIVQWSPDDKFVGCTCDNGKLYVLNAFDGRVHRTIDTPSSSAWAFSFINEGRQILAAGDYLIQRYDVGSGAMVFPNYKSTNPDNVALGSVTAFRQSSTGDIQVSAADAHVRIFDATGKLDKIITIGGKDNEKIRDSDFNKSGTKFFARLDKSYRFINLKTGDDETPSQPHKFLNKSAIPPKFIDDRSLIFSRNRNALDILDSKTQKERPTKHDQSGRRISNLILSGDRSKIIYSQDPTFIVTILSSPDGELIQQRRLKQFTYFNYSKSGKHAIFANKKLLTVYCPPIVLFTNKPTQKQLETWISQLSSTHYQTRHDAQVNLSKSGKIVEKYFSTLKNPDVETRYRISRIRRIISESELPTKKLGVLQMSREIADVCISNSGTRWAAILRSDTPEIVYGIIEKQKLKPIARATDGHHPQKIRFGNSEDQILTANNNGTVSLYQVTEK